MNSADFARYLPAVALFILLLLQNILGFITRMKGKDAIDTNTSGSKPPEFWMVEFRKAMQDSLTTEVLPILTKQTLILDKVSDALVRLNVMAEYISRSCEAKLDTFVKGGPSGGAN